MRQHKAAATLQLTWACVLAGILMLVCLSQTVERTPDERAYQIAGRHLLKREGMHVGEQLFQGPLILLGTQISDDHGESVISSKGLLKARLGMMVFPSLLLIALTFWSRRALGEHAGLITAFLAATNPTLIGYGPLLSSDIAFTATSILASWCCWRWLQQPTLLRLLCFGMALGATMATKYTGAITCAALGFIAIAAPTSGFDPWPTKATNCRRLPLRLIGSIFAVSIAAAIALGFLYAAYLFASPPFSSDKVADLSSPMIRSLARMPLGSSLLGILPEPMVLGIDHQAKWSGLTSNGFFLDQRGNHWGYYPLTVVCKTPVAVLTVAVAGIFLCRRATTSRGLWLTVLIPPLTLLAYCSGTRALQMGIRYVLPLIPAIIMLASVSLSYAWRHGRTGKLIAGLVICSSIFNLTSCWPHYIGFFNQLCGGQTGGARLFSDSNCDWEQRRETGRQALLTRSPDLLFLRANEGPRFGSIAIYNRTLNSLDPRDPSRAYHWLNRFEPFDHDGAAWLAYKITPNDFEQAIAAGDKRAAEELAMAWLLEHNFDAARRAINLVPIADFDPTLIQVAALIENIEAAGNDPAQRDLVANNLTTVGYHELALALVDKSNRQNAVKVFWLLTSMDRQLEGANFLEERGADGSRTIEEVFLLVASLCDGGKNYAQQPMRALELMKAGPMPAVGSPGHGPWQELMERVKKAINLESRLANY